jgi:hypothetical protein
MGIRKSILTSGGFASAIGICLATLSAGTLIVFSVIAAGVGFEEPSTAPSVAGAARGGAPAAITFPSAGRTSAENQGSRAGDTSLLDVIGSAGSALDQSTAAAPADGSAQTAAPDGSGGPDAGSGQVAGLVPDIDLGVDNALSGPALRSPRIKRGRDARPGDDAPKPGGKKDKDKDDDRVAGRRDDEDDPDHADDDDDDDDDDSDSSGSSDGSGLGRVHDKAAKAKAKAKEKAKGHSKSVDVHKGDRDKRDGSHHSHDSDSSDT